MLTRLFLFLQSEEFQKNFDCELNFYISHSIVSMHIWLICQRLQHFKRSKPAYDLLHEILNTYKKICKDEFENVDTLRRLSKFSTIEELYEDQKNMFNWHFYIYNPTVENLYLKIDSLVWSYIYREKIDRYDDRVFKLSHYFIYHFEKFKNYTFEDFETMNFKFDLLPSIPYNYRDKILCYNQVLDNENMFLEKFSKYQYKNYSYNYKTLPERNEEHLIKTYIRYEFYRTRDENILLRSNRPEDQLFDILTEQDYIDSLSKRIDESDINDSLFGNSYQKWLTKYIGKSVIKCEEEDIIRQEGKINDLKHLDGKPRFSEKLPLEKRKALYAYRYNLGKKEAEKEFYIQIETKTFYPDANVITSKKKNKAMIEKIFNL
jgi:hypothetical protein